MNVMTAIRERVGAVIGAVVFALICLVGGAAMAFIVSPQQAAEWRRIDNLDELTAGSFAAVAAGENVVVTGTIAGEAQGPEGYVFYQRQEWDVERDTDSDGDTTYDGDWNTIETVYPAFQIQLGDGAVGVAPATSITLSGDLRETITEGSGGQRASYQGQQLAEGSIRVRGLATGDVITVLGSKLGDGQLAPDRFHAGDRESLVQLIRSNARVFFWVGVAMMVLSPVVLIMGVVGAIFGRSNRSGGVNIKLGR
ncbi:MAG: hypothetical protein GYB68_17470 [Chloroflexi bacterium]|nr:hypothetical protein [Chloroflexota bacterium]